MWRKITCSLDVEARINFLTGINVKVLSSAHGKGDGFGRGTPYPL